MTYAGNRTILDADSHLMELPDFLDDFLEPADIERLQGASLLDALKPVVASGVDAFEARRSDPAALAKAEDRLLIDKGWSAMGAWDPVERSHVLDLLGFQAQLVFATAATAAVALPYELTKRSVNPDFDRLYGGCRAHNKAMGRFCASDDRLRAVAYVSLVDPDRAAAEARAAISDGCAAIMIPSTAPGKRSTTHPDLDVFWDVLNTSGIPFVLHVGGGGRLLDPAFHNNNMPVPDHLGGGENVRSKDFLTIYHSPATFLGILILDGLFDRFPNLRGGCIEQGAGWVVSWLDHIDYTQQFFLRTEEPIQRLQAKPSEYARRHLKFTPFPGENVGWMIEQSGAELFMFSTDYPHPEGGRDPLAKFDATLTETGEADQDKFFAGNLQELLGSAAVVR